MSGSWPAIKNLKGINVKIVGAKPNQAVIDLLKEALADAESGEIKGFAMASLNKDSVVYTAHERGDAPALSIAGAISILDKDFHNDTFTKD
jgi:hypothetical protein